MKILYFDTETTGLDPQVNEIIQFSAIVEIDGEVMEEVNLKFQPTDLGNIDPKALEVTGYTVKEMKEWDMPQQAAPKIVSLFNKYIDKYDKSDKFFPAGHNVQFDLDFLQSFWKRHIDNYGTGSYQNWRALDSRVFANFLNISGKLDIPNIRLETICTAWGIEIKAHDALSDIRATRQVIKNMLSLLTN